MTCILTSKSDASALRYHEMGAIIGRELRALWLVGATEASSWSGKPHAGLDCWSPNININRDPRHVFHVVSVTCVGRRLT